MNYEKKKLKDCCVSISDGDHLPPPKAETGVPFITISNIDGNNQLDFSNVMYVPEEYYNGLPANKKATVGDILYSVVGSFGKPIYISKDEKFVFQRHIAILKPNSDVDSKYLYYTMLNPMFYRMADKLAIGCAQRTITLDALRNIVIDVPPIERQQSITNALKAIDDKITLNNRINDNLQQMAKTIYDYWFTQFDFPNEHGNPYLSSNGQMVWNETAKQKLPVGWSCSKMETAIENIRTGLNPRDNFKLGGGSIKYITVKNLRSDGVLDFSGCDTIDEAARQIVHRRSDVSVGDILFASIAPLGRCYLVQEAPQDWDINESVFSIRYNKETVTPEYLYMHLQSEGFVKESTACSTGSIFKGIRINSLMDSKIIVPPMQIIEGFSKEVRPLFALQNKLNKETHALTQLRDWLLPMLMNGQATVSD